MLISFLITVDIKQETNKDGSGKGQWAAWKVCLMRSAVWVVSDSTRLLMLAGFALQASKLAKQYEAQGGDYENEAGSKNEPEKGAPHHKSEARKKAELEDH